MESWIVFGAFFGIMLVFIAMIFFANRYDQKKWQNDFDLSNSKSVQDAFREKDNPHEKSRAEE